MPLFSEGHSKLRGFSDYYNREILPHLEADEARRLAAVKKVKTRTPFIVIAGFIAAGTVFYFSGIVPLSFIVAVAGCILGGGYAAAALQDVKDDTKSRIVSGICDYIGWSFRTHAKEPIQLATMIVHGLLPKTYHRSSFEDNIIGKAHGADFEMTECHLEQKVKTKNGHTWKTVFRGAVLAIDFHRDFLGKTVVLRDKGFFNAKKKKDMKRIRLVDPVFEKIFEAYGTDQVEGRYLLPPDFMQKLVDLERVVDGKNIRFAFLDGALLIAVETPNRFEAGSMFKPLVDTARTQKILDEVAAVYAVIDGVMKPYEA